MADEMRARIARALRDHDRDMDGADPSHEASADYECCAAAVMAVLDEATAEALHEYADRLDAIDPQCTALTGPVWYGQGWHEAAHHLHDMADDHPGRMRREAGR
jgi:hypothetical protein